MAGKRQPKAFDVQVETVAVALPDEIAVDAWYRSMALLLDLADREAAPEPIEEAAAAAVGREAAE